MMSQFKFAYLLEWSPLFVDIMCFSCVRIATLRAVQPNSKRLALDEQQSVDESHKLVHHLPSHKLR